MYSVFHANAGAALAGLTGSVLVKKLRLTMQGFALFFLCFGLWFLWQSTYHIRALCILCLFCFGGLLLINWGWLAVNAADLPIGNRGRKLLVRANTRGFDAFAWILLATGGADADSGYKNREHGGLSLVLSHISKSRCGEPGLG